MARMRFTLEFKAIAEIDIDVPETFKELDEQTLKKIINDMVRPIVKNLDAKDLYVNKNEISIVGIKFPGPDKNTRFGYDKFPDLSITVNKFRLNYDKRDKIPEFNLETDGEDFLNELGYKCVPVNPPRSDNGLLEHIGTMEYLRKYMKDENDNKEDE